MMKRMLIAIALLTSACSGDSDEVACEDVTPAASLSVDVSDESPVISWTGGQVDELSVTDADNNSMWDSTCEIEARPCLASPITYGVQPAAASTDDVGGFYTLDPVALEAGVTYKVRVWRYCQDSDGDAEVSTETTFVAP